MRRGARYRLLEHTADIRAVGEGPDFETVASLMLLALADVIYGKEIAPGKEPIRRVSWWSESGDPALALIELLNDGLYCFAVGGELPIRYRGAWNRGELELTSLPTAEPMREVKAATYAGVRCEESADGTWEAEVVFDI